MYSYIHINMIVMYTTEGPHVLGPGMTSVFVAKVVRSALNPAALNPCIKPGALNSATGGTIVKEAGQLLRRRDAGATSRWPAPYASVLKSGPSLRLLIHVGHDD